MTDRVTIVFSPNERVALQEMCKQDVRPPKNLLRWLVVNEAKRRGILTATNNKSATSEVYEAEQVSAFAGINP